MLAHALEQAGDSPEEKDVKHSEKGDNIMKVNVFDKQEDKVDNKNQLTHDDMKVIFQDAKSLGSLKEAILKHAGTYLEECSGYKKL